MKKNILLTGASGSVGIEALKELVRHKKKYNIIVFDKKTSKSQKRIKAFLSQIKVFYGDITDKKSINKCTKNIDVVIHLAALIPPIADEKPELAEKINIAGTQNLINAIKQNSPNAFFLYSSSISVYGDRISKPWIKIDDKLVPSMGDEYAKTKIQAENIIKNSGLKWSIFRLSAIMDFQQEFDPLLFHMPLNTSFEITTARDTGYAMVQAIEHTTQLKYNLYNLGGGKKCRTSFKSFITKAFQISGLGQINFPKFAFAKKNFHCGFYKDGYKLDEIIHFRRDSLNDYFKNFEKNINPVRKFFTLLFNKLIKKYLLKKSEPLKAYIENDKKLMQRFF